MQHLDHGRLVFLALGESEADTDEATHLDTCAPCRGEVESLRHVAGLGTSTRSLRELPAPPEALWQGILADVREAEATPAGAGSVRRRPPAEADAPTGTGSALPPAPGAHSRWRRWVTTGVTAAAAALLGVVGTLVVVRSGEGTTDPAGEQVVLATAPLAAYGPTPPQARGEARVFDDGRLHLHVANLPEVPGYYEVWLINPTNGRMFSVGVLGAGSDVLLPLPPTVDLTEYSVVDISAERFDDDPGHSGDSLLRGVLAE
ncbi:anti-sigma factor [Micromonospora sp. SH-82]|uniref:anti-sigma factor n=1 Tax=Micromonospora sp. SH-82 TaxID=3132938 RepID=UPI003EB917A7